jgi:hypothetical protein
MDSRLFRLPTAPHFYASISAANPFDTDQQRKRSEIATRDSRFPGWAAPMEDGRLVTDYLNHCSKNIPVGQQFATKEWMTKNAIEIMKVNRERLAAQNGSIYGLDDSVVPPPALIVKCATNDCVRSPTDIEGGIGVERADATAPELFGTWDLRQPGVVAPPPKVAVTTRYEGGRNTPRGGEPELR